MLLSMAMTFACGGAAILLAAGRIADDREKRNALAAGPLLIASGAFLALLAFARAA